MAMASPSAGGNFLPSPMKHLASCPRGHSEHPVALLWPLSLASLASNHGR